MSVKIIIPREGQLYSSACAEILRDYVNASSEREKRQIRETPEFREAFDCLQNFHSAIQANVFFGEEVVSAMSVVKAQY